MLKVEEILKREVEDQKTPSVNYFIFDQKDLIYKFKKGFSDIKGRQETNDNTTYKAFSVTKTFTALSVLQLAEKNKLCIDDPVKKYLPEFPYSAQITIKQLMTHSTGIPNPIPLNWIHLAEEEQTFDRTKFFTQIFRKHNRLNSKPGEKFSYSNLGYVLLGQLIEKVSGLKYEDYVRGNIIKPLDLKPEDLDFTVANPGHHAKGYFKRFSFTNILLGFFLDKKKYVDETEGKWIAFKSNYVNGASYGGLIGTPLAFVRFVQELLKRDSSLINDNYKQMLFTENISGNNKASGMGLSWFSGKLKGKNYFAHAGGGGGYYSEIRIYPELEIGSVIMFNRTGMTDERYLDKVDKYFI